jgi:hypothetical protein
MWMIAWLLLQDSDLQRGLETTMKQSSYTFSIERPAAAGKKKKAKAAPEISGVFASGILYLKYGTTEIARSNDLTYVNLNGAGWKNFGEITPPKTGEDELSLAELVKIPSPHLLAKTLIGQIRKAVPEKKDDGTEFDGDISDTTARELAKEPWFAQGADKDLSQASGSMLVTVNKDHLITALQIDIEAKVMADDPKAPPPRRSGRHPRATAGHAGTEGSLSVRIKLNEFGSAKLSIPEDLQKKLKPK